ncbi:hypothetical protein D3C71_2087720 [compost metagenome]
MFKVDRLPDTSKVIFSVELAPIWNVIDVDSVPSAAALPLPSSLVPPNVVLVMTLYSS